MDEATTIFDPERAREAVVRGRRARWWERRGTKPGRFRYFDAGGKQIADDASLERIRKLVIPPAWKYVRVNPFAGGKIQAVGVDAMGRIQYRYHANFAEKQQRKKFAKIERFGEFIPRLKQVTSEHIALSGLPKEKVLAVIMRLINSLYFRVGTELSERHYKTYGVTTLRRSHLTIGKNGKLEFNFVGKSHVQHRKVLVDPDLSAVVGEIYAMKRGRRLFRYVDSDGKLRPITPALINRYLKDATAPEFSAKDFRTWGGTLLAASMLAEIGTADSENAVKKNIVKAVKHVAEELGNTPSVCRGSYIHPLVLDSYSKGVTIDEFRPRRSRSIKGVQIDLEPEEKALMRLFKANGVV
ncbi:MAG: hypothetical protein QM785_14620 [Pyrinomonadaceae bacterium]